MKLIDLHCDTVLKLFEQPSSKLCKNNFSIDLEKLDLVESMAQVFAVFIDQGKVTRCLEAALAMLQHFEEEVARNNQLISFARNGREIRANMSAGKKSALMAIEEGAVLEGKLENLHVLHEKGVRFLTLTWNYPNEIGYPHGDEYGTRGLTSFGIDLVHEMERIGIIPDVSHLSEGGFWDVATHFRKPFMATHSNCRALKEHTRNLTDKQIRGLGDSGGIMGISVVKNFLLATDVDEGRLEAMVANIKHVENVAGIDTVAIGTDFDGTATNHELNHIGDLSKLEFMLRKAGYKDDKLEKIYWRNALRVIDSVLL